MSPCSPYFLLREKVCQIINEAPPAPRSKQIYEFTPAIYKIITKMSVPNNPPANRNRYCAFSPLNSTVLPIPLLILYFIRQSIKGRMNEEWWLPQSRRYTLRTNSLPFWMCQDRHY